MEHQDIISIALNKKGQFASIKTSKSLKVKKGFEPIIKQSSYVARIGISYDNMAKVQEGRQDGTLPEQNQGLPWGEWLHYPVIIKHNANLYLRLAVTFNDNQKSVVKYFMNGNEITRELAKTMAYASEFLSDNLSDALLVFNVNFDNIVDIK